MKVEVVEIVARESRIEISWLSNDVEVAGVMSPGVCRGSPVSGGSSGVMIR